MSLSDTPTPDTATPTEATAATSKPQYGFSTLKRALLVTSPTNPRKHFDPAALTTLAETMKADGVLQPLLVRPLPASRLQETFVDRRAGDPLPTHEIVAGERRYRASGLARIEELPVLIRELDDATVLRMQVIENVERESLHPLEEANGYRRILDLPDQGELSMEDRVAALAHDVKKSTRYIYQTLQLLKLCDFAQRVFLAGKLQRSTAVLVASIGNEAQQIEATRRIAGLARTGQSLDVIDRTMSQREAADYVARNFRLRLSNAAFPIKVEFAGVGPCTACSKMSANARDLLDEGPKVPDTCMDPSCYGKKATAHADQVAAAAKAKGQRVISGKEARKHVPYESNPEAMSSTEYMSLEQRLWSEVDPKHQGKTIQQLLGTDVPAPVLIQRADGQGFVEALPKKDVMRLIQDRGLAKAKGAAGKSEEAKKAEREAAARLAVAEELLQTAGAGVELPDAIAQLQTTVTTAPAHAALLTQLMPWIGARMYADMSDDQYRRVAKLLPLWGLERRGAVTQALDVVKDLDAAKFNQLMVAMLISSELSVHENYRSALHVTLDVGQALGIDVEARVKTATDLLKQAERAKAAGKKAAAKKPDAKKAPAKAAKAPSAAPAPTAAPQAATSADEPANGFAVGQRVRIKDGLKGPAGMLRKCCGRKGTIESKIGDRAWSIRHAKGRDGIVVLDYTEIELLSGPAAQPEDKAQPKLKANTANWPYPTNETPEEEDEPASEKPVDAATPKLTPQQAWPFPPAGR